jgi:hypothetical protein
MYPVIKDLGGTRAADQPAEVAPGIEGEDMNRSLARALICATVPAVLIGLSPLPASAVTTCTADAACTWNDVPDTDYAGGGYGAISPVGIVTWQCVDDGDVEEPCMLHVQGVPPVSLVICTAGTSGETGIGFFNYLPREGMTSTCLFLRTPAARINWFTDGSTAGTIS